MIETDHKPLIYIFSPNNSVRTDTSSRLMRFALKMMHFDYEIKYVPGIKNVVADELSRSCIDDAIRVPIIQFTEPCIKLESLESEYQADRFLQELKQHIISGNWNNASAREKPFKRLALQMSIDDKGHIQLGSKLFTSTNTAEKNHQCGAPIAQWHAVGILCAEFNGNFFGPTCAIMWKPS